MPLLREGHNRPAGKARKADWLIVTGLILVSIFGSMLDSEGTAGWIAAAVVMLGYLLIAASLRYGNYGMTGTRVRGYKGTWVQGNKGMEVSGYTGTRGCGYKGTRVHGI